MTHAPPLSPHQRLQQELLARRVLAAVQDDPNRPILASLIAGRANAEGMLPADLGLSADNHAQLWRDYFDGAPLLLSGEAVAALPEGEDLLALLLAARAGRFPSEVWLAKIVVTACAGKEHLWFDLGLANRQELSQLLSNAFPDFAQKNVGDMKWKKFLYRTYCAHEGIYFCPAPSCDECTDYALCFAPEV
ncbi:MAG: nitrogen fixation protein NifQ [Zoogloeaceae bacterium]|jgi:nitrogen fixation protein NifQ|nr:nitrogen fixation protein NifQ [Zoogloeaceae bacterium]